MSEKPASAISQNLACRIDQLTREGSVDFHLHSSFSDGSETPHTIAKLMIGAGLRAFALTDHDTTKGIVQAAALLDKLSAAAPLLHTANPDRLDREKPRSDLHTCFRETISPSSLPLFFPGVELSCEFEGQEVHVLAYFWKKEAAFKLRPYLRTLGRSREKRNRKMVERLRELGFAISMEELRSLAENKVGRVHMGQWLIKHGVVQDMSEAFERYLGRDGLAYIPRERQSVAESIQHVHEAGGVAFIAHPHEYGWCDEKASEQGKESSEETKEANGRNYENSRKGYEKMRLSPSPAKRKDFHLKTEKSLLSKKIERLLPCGLDGIEAFHSQASPEARALALAVAEQFSLPVCAGSDWHGSNRPGRDFYKKGSTFF